jgi:hypothetical protein
MIAAAPTSLPEVVGGSRNWDYRYCWVRDASFTLDALWIAAWPDEAEKFFTFLTHAGLGRMRQGTELPVMFGVGGEHDLTERKLPHLGGWCETRPVLVGNGAWDQHQLDVYGELMGAAARLTEQLEEMSDTTRDFLVSVVDAAADRWREPDHGIWEMRGEPRHFLHSKLMCWVSLDRGIRMASLLRAESRAERWTEEREAVRGEILERGWSESAGAFTQSFGDEALDASVLVMSIVGFLPADDPRVRGTIRAIAERLTDPAGLVYRYRADDGMEGEEGAFLLCTFWLAEAQALAGDVDAARDTFERAARFVNDVGLLSEQVDARNGELSATSRRRSATSSSSMPRGRSARPGGRTGTTTLAERPDRSSRRAGRLSDDHAYTAGPTPSDRGIPGTRAILATLRNQPRGAAHCARNQCHPRPSTIAPSSIRVGAAPIRRVSRQRCTPRFDERKQRQVGDLAGPRRLALGDPSHAKSTDGRDPSG